MFCPAAKSIINSLRLFWSRPCTTPNSTCWSFIARISRILKWTIFCLDAVLDFRFYPKDMLTVSMVCDSVISLAYSSLFWGSDYGSSVSLNAFNIFVCKSVRTKRCDLVSQPKASNFSFNSEDLRALLKVTNG